MPLRLSRIPRAVWFVLGLALLAVAWLTRSAWLPPARNAWAATTGGPAATADQAAHDEHAGHDHAAHGDAGSKITLSPQAMKNIGLRTGPVTLGPYERTISVPAIVAERAGRTDLVVPAPLTGFVEDVLIGGGQEVSPGDPLFVLRLTNEDVVQAQTEYLKTIESLDVENREIKRLESITSGVIAEKVILERRYARQKLEGLLKAQRQALLLHGMSDAQVDAIARDRRLLREFLISAPQPHDDADPRHLEREHPELVPHPPAAAPPAAPEETVSVEKVPLVVQELPVKRGQSVQAGDALAVLADLRELYVEGRAFARDAAAVTRAAANGWGVTAVPDQGRGDSPGIERKGLEIAYVANAVDPQTRALKFFAILPNEVVGRSQRGDRAYPTWRYRPGQRLDLRVPVERWTDRIVLPLSAVAEQGPEAYVFVRSGKAFERRPVHVEYRGRDAVVIANDGSVFPGEVVALSAAQQLQMAIQNQAGGGVDLHAGHMH